jgi:hypothetical protein
MFDKIRHGAEIELLIGCTNEDIQIIRILNDEASTRFI